MATYCSFGGRWYSDLSGNAFFAAFLLSPEFPEIARLQFGLFICTESLLSNTAHAWGEVLDQRKIRQIFAMNLDIWLRAVMFEVVVVSFTFIAARFGNVRLTVNQVFLRFLMTASYALYGITLAVEALVGQFRLDSPDFRTVGQQYYPSYYQIARSSDRSYPVSSLHRSGSHDLVGGLCVTRHFPRCNANRLDT